MLELYKIQFDGKRKVFHPGARARQSRQSCGCYQSLPWGTAQHFWSWPGVVRDAGLDAPGMLTLPQNHRTATAPSMPEKAPWSKSPLQTTMPNPKPLDAQHPGVTALPDKWELEHVGPHTPPVPWGQPPLGGTAGTRAALAHRPLPARAGASSPSCL